VIIFKNSKSSAAHLRISRSTQFENHWPRVIEHVPLKLVGWIWNGEVISKTQKTVFAICPALYLMLMHGFKEKLHMQCCH